MGKVKLKSTKGDKVKNRPDSQPMENASAEQLGHVLAFASSSAVRAVPRKKKEKRKMRHEALVKKIEAGKIVKKKHHKKKAHVPRALDMRNLMDALPTMVERKAAKAGTIARLLASRGMDLGGPSVCSSISVTSRRVLRSVGNLLHPSPVLLSNRGASDNLLFHDHNYNAVSLSGAPSSSQPSRDLGGAGDASLLRWHRMGDGSIAQLCAERRRQARANLAQQSAPSVGEKRKREEFH